MKRILLALALLAIAVPLAAQQGRSGNAADALRDAKDDQRAQRLPSRAELEAAVRARHADAVRNGLPAGHMIWFVADASGRILSTGVSPAKSLPEVLPHARRAHPAGIMRREHSAQIKGENGWLPIAWLIVE